MTQSFGKRGVPVLAYPTTDTSSPLLLSLVFKYNERNAQATLSLQSSIFLYGFEAAQSFILQYDAAVFKASEDVDPNIETDDATTEDEQPPPYVEVSSKRQRHTSISSTSSSPIRKRVLLSPSEPWPSSATEKDSTAKPSPRPPYFPAVISPNLREAMHDANSKVVLSVSETVLQTLLTVPSSPMLLPPSQTSHTSPQVALSALNTTLSKHVTRSIEQKLESICANTLSHASYLRDIADTEFMEELADVRLDIGMAKEDCVTELDRIAVEKLDTLREECQVVEEEVCDRVDQRALIAYDTVSEKIDACVGSKMDILRRERGWLGRERAILERDKRRFEAVKRSGHVERGAR